MKEQTTEQVKLKNSQVSVWMIITNTILLAIYLNYGYLSENQRYANILYMSVGILILLGCFAFSYHGKGYNIGKWIFGVMLIITLALFGMAVYVAGLAAAFQH